MRILHRMTLLQLVDKADAGDGVLSQHPPDLASYDRFVVFFSARTASRARCGFSS